MASSELTFVSFGSDAFYRKLARNTLKQLREIYPGATYKTYGVSDLNCGKPNSECSPSTIKQYAALHPRGYGYWRWKPCVIATALANQNDGGVVVYVDGRCSIPKEPVSWISDFLTLKSSDLVAWQTNYLERVWTTTDLLSKFGIGSESPEALSGQFAATFFGIRNSRLTRSFVNNWETFLIENASLCRDDHPRLTNSHDFIENRYDQSSFSLLLKRREELLSLMTLTDFDVMFSPSMRPHGKPHPLGSRVVRKLRLK